MIYVQKHLNCYSIKNMINRFPIVLLSLALIILFACKTEPVEKKKVIKKSEVKEKPEVKVEYDLEDILKEGKLKALTTYSSTSYFLYRGQAMGYEYELLSRFAEHLGVELEISVANDIDNMFNNLNQGRNDLIAHGLTITGDRKEDVRFTDYLYLTHQVLVQKKPDNWRKLKWSKLQGSVLHDAIELIGDTVSVRQNSAYFDRLENLSEEFGGKIHIDTLPGELSTDKIIEMVVDGEIKYTIADNNFASINASYYPILNVEVPISFSQRMAWAVRKSSPNLEKAINEWLDEMKDDVAYYVIYNKYFKNERGFRLREKSDYSSLNKNQISKYDKLIKKYAKVINWDWRLLAAQIYQESRFNPKANSWAGANGLMQIMPATAKGLGVTDRGDPNQSIKGGTKYLKILWNRFEEIEDSVQRTKFCMASYNCGYNHVADARRLAKKEGLNPNKWDDNVEKMILELSYPKNYNKPFIYYGYVRGREPFAYVRHIFERYDHYREFIN